MPKTIGQLGNSLAASDVDDDSAALVPVEYNSISYKMPLPELRQSVTGSLNVRDFGAVGDGVTDDATAIQATIDAAGDGGTVIIPAASYCVGTTLKLNSATVIVGLARGHEGNSAGGASLKWIGAESSVVLRVNDGSSGATVHGWTLRNFSVNGDDVAGVIGIVVGAGNDGTPRAAVGTLECLYVSGCDIGIECRTAQLCEFNYVHVTGCGTGIKFSSGTNYANTACNLISCRVSTCGIGYHLQRLTGSRFSLCTAELNTDEGFKIEDGATGQSILQVQFDSPWIESNLTGGGSGRAQFSQLSSASGSGSSISIINPRFGLTPSGNYDLQISGGIFQVEWPTWHRGMLMLGSSAGYKTYLFGRWAMVPNTWCTVTNGTGVARGMIEFLDPNGLESIEVWTAQNSAFVQQTEVTHSRVYMYTLPSSNPGQTNQLWNNYGTVRVSGYYSADNNVRDYGALGNGVADDTSAIQAAIDAAGIDGKVVFPDGVYVISNTLTVNRGLLLEGYARGHEGNAAGGAVLKWGGSSDGVMLRVNTGTTGYTVHGWTIRGLSLNGNAVSGVTGMLLGAGNDGTPSVATGTLENLWFYNCNVGLDCWSAQYCNFFNLHTYVCNTGIKFSGGTNRDNMALNVIGCRCRSGDVGIHIQNLRGAVFHQCTAETNADQGVLIENGTADYECFSLVFDELWLGNNLTAGGTGRGQVDCSTIDSSSRNQQLIFRQPKFSSTPSGNYDMRLHGGDYVVDWPYLEDGIEVHGGSANAATSITGRWLKDPESFLTVTAGSGTLQGVIDYFWSGSSRRTVYVIKLNGLVKNIEYTTEGMEASNAAGAATNKSYRWATYHYSTDEESMLNVMGTSVSGSNQLYLGGGSSIHNAATDVRIYAAANATTLTGTEQMRIANNAIHMYTLPTSNPNSAGQLWNNGGVLSVSSG